MNNPKIAIAVFVEYGGWGGSAAAPVAALIAERYLKRKTEATKLDEHVKKQYLLPPVSMLPGYKGPKQAPQIRKPDSMRKDTGRKVEKLKPMMASNSGE